MIEMLEGVPGSGKSYHAVAEKLLPWLRAGRRLYVAIDGIYLDRLAVFENRTVEELRKQITCWVTKADVLEGLLTVEPGAAVLIDEAQTIFRSKEKLSPELLRWLETHRHRGIDLVLMCQQYGQVTLGVNRLVEATTKFRRLDRFGLKNRYQASVRGNPEELEVIRMFTGKYEPKLYAYYSSYSSATVRETARGGSMLKSPTVLIGGLGLVMALGWFAFGGWLSGAKPAPAAAVSKLSPPPPLPVVQASQPVAGVPVAMPSPVRPVRIHGGMTTMREGAVVWLWVSADGQLMTEAEIAGESGGTVSSRMVRGVRVLTGTGVIYGGTRAETTDATHLLERVAAERASSPAPAVPSTSAGPSAPASSGGPTTPDPPPYVPTHPGILATPPGLL